MSAKNNQISINFYTYMLQMQIQVISTDKIWGYNHVIAKENDSCNRYWNKAEWKWNLVIVLEKSLIV